MLNNPVYATLNPLKIKEFKSKTKHFDIDATDTVGRTALMWAADCGQLDAVELLLRLGADVQLTEARTGRYLPLPGLLAWRVRHCPDVVHHHATVATSSRLP